MRNYSINEKESKTKLIITFLIINIMMQKKLYKKAILLVFLLGMFVSNAQDNKLLYDSQKTYYSLNEALKEPEKVIILDLSNSNLTNFPSEIKYFINLTELNLSCNSIRQIDFNLGILKSLEKLDISFNSLEILPESFACLSNLKVFTAYYNRFKELPDSIGKLRNLRILELSSNGLIRLPNSIGELENLYYLDLNNNQLENLPQSFGNLINLRILGLSSNSLTTLPENFGNLINLERLGLDINNIDSIPNSFRYLKKLKWCYLRSNNLQYLPSELALIPNLNVLDIDIDEISNSPDSSILNNASKQFKEIYNSLINNGKTKKIMDKDALIKKLNEEINRLEEYNLQLRKNKNIFLIGISFLVILLVLCFYLLRKNIKRKKQIEVTLRRIQEQQAELLQKEKDTFIANMVEGFAHDIKNPLDGIETYISALLRYSELNMQFDNTIDTLKYLQNRISGQEKLHTKLLNSILPIKDWISAFQSINLSQIENEVAEFSLNCLFNDLRLLNEMKLDKNNITLEIKSEEDVFISSVKGMLSQVFQNIIANAIEHGFKDYVRKDKKISVQINSDTKRVTVSIKNNGRPIPNENLSKIFDRYHSSVEHGFRGLGLFTVKRNVEDLHGTIKVTSDEENGVEFIITLPATQPEVENEA